MDSLARRESRCPIQRPRLNKEMDQRYDVSEGLVRDGETVIDY
jgi:hypothetical protein